MKVIKSELDYTGGNIWCTWGLLDDGTFFCGSDNCGFEIYKPSVFKYIRDHKNEYLGDDTRLYDIGGLCDDSYLIRYTDDDSDETFEIWDQVYTQHEDDCSDIDYLREELFEMHNKDKELNIRLKLTFKELQTLNDLLLDKSYLKEVEPIFCKVHDEYVNAQGD